MSPEWWREAYENAVLDVADIESVDMETAERYVDGYVKSDPKYLNDYIMLVAECHR
ncbi:hypothetical protein LCGC14_0457010 [marine sediment metagenome]|uniref:Uncharacterized protein n=1 Tax=marine sediment metagenome TaxID=412755 RepID=A0A0F9SLK8_9ZZZZ